VKNRVRGGVVPPHAVDKNRPSGRTPSTFSHPQRDIDVLLGPDILSWHGRRSHGNSLATRWGSHGAMNVSNTKGNTTQH